MTEEQWLSVQTTCGCSLCIQFLAGKHFHDHDINMTATLSRFIIYLTPFRKKLLESLVSWNDKAGHFPVNDSHWYVDHRKFYVTKPLIEVTDPNLPPIRCSVFLVLRGPCNIKPVWPIIWSLSAELTWLLILFDFLCKKCQRVILFFPLSTSSPTAALLKDGRNVHSNPSPSVPHWTGPRTIRNLPKDIADPVTAQAPPLPPLEIPALGLLAWR